jgi:hypothetical protein
MPTRNEIIEDLFTGKNFNDCLSKMNPSGLRDDLKQEVALIVCEMPEEKLVQLKQQNHLEFYVVKIILNLVKNKYSPFTRKFRTIFQELSEHEKVDEPEDSGARAARERVEDVIIDEILTVSGNHPDWYHNTLLRLYIEVGNYRAIEHATRIPYASCYKSIQKYMNQLKGKAIHYSRNLELCQKK